MVGPTVPPTSEAQRPTSNHGNCGQTAADGHMVTIDSPYYKVDIALFADTIADPLRLTV